MAREYARIKLTIWADPDFRDISAEAQRLYFLLLTSGSLSLCGVADWREARLVALAADTTVDDLRHAAWELGQKRLIAIDLDTEEVLVRSFVRHDGVLKSPNITTAMAKDYGSVASQKLMRLISHETRRAFLENPDWKGSLAARPVAKQFPDFDGNDPEMVPAWFKNGSKLVPGTVPKQFENGSEMVPNSSDLLGSEPFGNGSPIPLPTTYYPSNEGVQGEGSADKQQPSVATTDVAAPEKTKKGTRLTEDWEPDPDRPPHVKALEAHGHDWVAEQFANFQDHWLAKAGASATKLDWDRTWHTWLRRAKDFTPHWKQPTPDDRDWREPARPDWLLDPEGL